MIDSMMYNVPLSQVSISEIDNIVFNRLNDRREHL